MEMTAMSVEERLNGVLSRIRDAEHAANRPIGAASLVAVSKTFDADAIRPVIATGQRTFGENRVQEAQGKWPELKAETADIELHLIGPLQSNKAADAVALFDVIETIDREKIAHAVAAEIIRQDKPVRLYVQGKSGLAPHKGGISPDDTVAFVTLCRETIGIPVEGLMCIPPADENPGPHFALLAKLAERCGVKKLSMGMSGDFDIAVQFGATSVRVGSAIFGTR
jgi:pyridoxal phosphate enzyme (YggS family)